MSPHGGMSFSRPMEPDELVIRPGSGATALAALRELTRYRGVVWALMDRSVRIRYKQAALGVAWALIQPLAFVALFSIVFGQVARIPGGSGLQYAAFAITALVPWQFVSTAVLLGLNSFVADAALLRKVYIPREGLVLAAIGPALLDFGLGLAMTVLLLPILGGHLGIGLVFVPLLVALLAVPVLGICLAVATLNAYFRDFRVAVPLAVQLWLFASPVIYPITSVSEQWRSAYAVLNPIVGPLESFRRCLALGGAPDWGLLALSLLSGTTLLVIGHRVMKRLEPALADVV